MTPLCATKSFFFFFFFFFFFYLNKKKNPSLSKKERNTKFNTNDLILGKKIYLPSRTLLSAESLANKSNIPKIPFSLVPSKKYIMIKKFKDKLKILKNILNEIKNLRLLREQDINEIKK